MRWYSGRDLKLSHGSVRLVSKSKRDKLGMRPDAKCAC